MIPQQYIGLEGTKRLELLEELARVISDACMGDFLGLEIPLPFKRVDEISAKIDTDNSRVKYLREKENSNG